MIKLSIIVPVYNMASGGKLEYCINSLLNQTLDDYEVIAVDDKSTDNSLEVLRCIEKEHPGKLIVIESEENGRQGAARNKGLKVAKGEFIGFMDADDWVLPDTYECAINKAIETGADVVSFDMCLTSEHTMIPTQRVSCNTENQAGIINHDKRSSLILNSGPVSTKVYRREFFYDPDFRFPEKMAYEDNAVSIEMAMRIKHLEVIPETKCFYYQHEDSTTHYVTLNNIEDRKKAMRIFLSIAKDRNVMNEFHDEIEYLFAKRFYATTLFSYMQSDIQHSISFIKDLGEEVKSEFPDFLKNSYFLDSLDNEQLKLIKLQQKSSFIFYFYYSLKKFYRLKRYGRW